MNNLILKLALAAVPTIVAITLHEAAHGYAALAMGDDTARKAGRLSLNPLAHVDRVGTILLPGFLVILQLATIGRIGFMFGWAKPVPIAPWRFRKPRQGMMVVAAAGPAMNFLLAWLGAVLLYVVPAMPLDAQPWLLQGLFYFMLANIMLGVFNLLPIPPLDGGRIAVGLLPERAAIAWARLERAGLFIVLICLFVLPQALNQLGLPFDPIRSLLYGVGGSLFDLILALAGHPGSGNVILGNTSV